MGFSNSDISALFPHEDGGQDFAHEQQTELPAGAATGAGTIGVLVGALGRLAGVGTVAIPASVHLIAADPILGALSGAPTGWPLENSRRPSRIGHYGIRG